MNYDDDTLYVAINESMFLFLETNKKVYFDYEYYDQVGWIIINPNYRIMRNLDHNWEYEIDGDVKYFNDLTQIHPTKIASIYDIHIDLTLFL